MNNKALVGRFLGSEVAAKARQLKKNGLVLSAKLKTIVLAAPPAKNLVVNIGLTENFESL